MPIYNQEWLNKNPGKGNEEYDAEIKKLTDNAYYSVKYDPGQTEGGEGCGTPGCLGGRVGTERNLAFDLKVGKYFSVSNNLNILLGIALFALLVLVGAIYLHKRRKV